MFLPIPNFPHYMWNPDTLEVKSLQRIVNDNGGLRKIKEKILKPSLSPSGYYRYNLFKDGKSTYLRRSQISWLTKYGHLPNKNLCIDHIDENKLNDNINNLQLLTAKDNVHKSFVNRNKHKPTGVSKIKYKNNIYYMARKMVGGKNIYLGLFTSYDEANKAYNL